MSHVFEKVFLLRQLNLPFDMIEEINSMCFYDRETTNTRTTMRNILCVIKKPVMNGFSDTGEWCFWADEHENQFQGQNCLRCGNYSYAYYANTSTNLICHC